MRASTSPEGTDWVPQVLPKRSLWLVATVVRSPYDRILLNQGQRFAIWHRDRASNVVGEPPAFMRG